jgi:hypothetical protein
MHLMKSTNLVLTLMIALVVTACGSGSSFPEATGKGTIRAINAIKTSPQVSFRIEQFEIGSINFREASSPAKYDDLEYDFGFDVRFVGESEVTTVAIEHLDVVAETDYTMLLSGTLANSTVTVWESTDREFDGTETVFEARFVNAADSAGSIDVYFAADGVAPILGEEIGTLSLGEILPPIDFDAGEYVLIATTSGNPGDILFQSVITAFGAAAQYTVPLFDTNQNTHAPFISGAYPADVSGATSPFAIVDANYPAVVEFINGSLPLGSVDIYDDDMQSSLVVDNLAHKNIAAELDLMVGGDIFYITPSDVNQPVLIEHPIDSFIGIRARVVTFGDTDTLRGVSYLADRRPVETHAKVQIFNSSINFETLSLFAVEVDEVLDDQLPFVLSLGSATASQVVAFQAGSFDFYIREFNEPVNLAGPIRIDMALGDVISAVVFDTVDPAVLELETIPNNP